MSEPGLPRNRAERRAVDRSNRRNRMSRAAGSALVVSSTALATTAALFGAAGPAGALPMTFTVDTTTDGAAVPADCTTPVVGSCSLRDAIAAANANVGADTINFSALGTITLQDAFGQLAITEDLTISGPFLPPAAPVGSGPGDAAVVSTAVTVNGHDNQRIFDITGSSDVTISGLTLTHGLANAGGAIRWGTGHLTLQNSIVTLNESSGAGGGLYSEGSGETLTIQNSQITHNVAYYSGGGVFASSVDGVTITDSVITDNEAGVDDGTGDGGGLYLASGDGYTAAVLIQRTTISSNKADEDGGGLAAGGMYGTFTIEDSTISGNTAGGLGGGLGLEHFYDVTTIRNTVISGNQSGDKGGGIYGEEMNGGFYITGSQLTGNSTTDGGGGGLAIEDANQPLHIMSSTISGNSGDYGGGLYIRGLGSDYTLTIVNTTIANNQALYAGGGIEWYRNSGALVVRNSTLSGNMAGLGDGQYGGGGLYATSNNYGLVQIVQSTISGNSADGEGGAIWFGSYYGLEIVQSTITANSATSVGGVYIPPPEIVPKSQHDTQTATGAEKPEDKKKHAIVDATHRGVAKKSGGAHASVNTDIAVTMVGTILAKNTGFDLGIGGTATADHSLIGTKSGSTAFVDSGGNLIGLDPLLAALANNGGPTQTHALTDVSPAINAGPDPVPVYPDNANDQRGPGFPRVTNGRVDIGAYETPQVVVILPAFAG